MLLTITGKRLVHLSFYVLQRDMSGKASVGNGTSPSIARKGPPRLLLSLESYSSHGSDNHKKHDDQKPSATLSMNPPLSSCLFTGLVFVSFLVVCEQLGRLLFERHQHWHVLLENATNRHILARHLFVDTLSCAICALCGWLSRKESFYPFVNGTISAADFEQRLYAFSPHGFRVSLFFFWYQVKNLIDTIVWNDGPEYVFHHVFSIFTALGAMFPGCGHIYTLFFFGLSEISTAVLCILANFDDQHGVVGLGSAFPTLKVLLGAVFVVCFILCRCILWPLLSYHFCRDILQGLQSNDPRALQRRSWMKFFLVSLSGISVLQVAWLGQIFILGQQELEKVGLL
jgi:TLC domain